MLRVLHELYAARTTSNKANTRIALARLKYAEHKMDEYLSKWEQYSAQLAAMGSSIDDGRPKS